jgi:DNA-binding CsgD family transcriptional regulator
MTAPVDPAELTAGMVPEAAVVALNMFAVPAYLLRPNCEILASNSSGPALLRTSRAFFANHGKLTVRRANDSQALTEAVIRVAARGEVELLRFLTRQDEASALMRLQPVPGQPLVIVGIAELRAPMLVAPGWSRAAFGFSAPHAALAESLALGHSLADFALAEHLPIGTVRTRLKKLLVQTGTSSQASLAAMLQRASVIMIGAERLAAPPKTRRSQGA